MHLPETDVRDCITYTGHSSGSEEDQRPFAANHAYLQIVSMPTDVGRGVVLAQHVFQFWNQAVADIVVIRSECWIMPDHKEIIGSAKKYRHARQKSHPFDSCIHHLTSNSPIAPRSMPINCQPIPGFLVPQAAVYRYQMHHLVRHHKGSLCRS